ncbi:MAG TPA: HAD-IIIA family hydrolase [Candidatus Xenobia bacterium]|jgi:hypothetical protein
MSLPRPDLICRSVATVDFSALSRLGRTAVMLDVDNTIALRRGLEVVPDIQAALLRARSDGYVTGLCLVSNTMWGRRREARVAAMARSLDASFVCARWWAPKPRPGPFRRALRLLRAEAAQAVMIGDQYFTDVKGAHRLGIYTVLVEPLGPDAWFTAFRRWQERRLSVREG